MTRILLLAHRVAQVVAFGGLLGLSACGKESAPAPPGPSDQVTFPKIYPTK